MERVSRLIFSGGGVNPTAPMTEGNIELAACISDSSA